MVENKRGNLQSQLHKLYGRNKRHMPPVVGRDLDLEGSKIGIPSPFEIEQYLTQFEKSDNAERGSGIILVGKRENKELKYLRGKK